MFQRIHQVFLSFLCQRCFLLIRFFFFVSTEKKSFWNLCKKMNLFSLSFFCLYLSNFSFFFYSPLILCSSNAFRNICNISSFGTTLLSIGFEFFICFYYCFFLFLRKNGGRKKIFFLLKLKKTKRKNMNHGENKGKKDTNEEKLRI